MKSKSIKMKRGNKNKRKMTTKTMVELKISRSLALSDG